MKRFSICVLLQSAMLLAGCAQEESVDPETLAIRKQLFSAEAPPAQASTISAVRLVVLDNQQSQADAEVTIKGTIDANGFDPWEKDRAVFAVMDASDEYVKAAKAHNHDDGDCPFCKHKSEPSQFMATVQIVDEQGTVLPRGAKSLLGLQTKQTVVVQGKGSINDQNMLVVVAKKISLAN